MTVYSKITLFDLHPKGTIRHFPVQLPPKIFGIYVGCLLCVVLCWWFLAYFRHDLHWALCCIL